MYVNPGELNRMITIVKDSCEKNENGFPVGEDILVHKCRAKYTRKTGKKKESAGTEIGEYEVRFLIRYTKKELDIGMKVKYREKTYAVEDINDIGDEHRYIEIFCKQGER